MLAHAEALVNMAANAGCDRIRIHAFLDGRDTAPTSGKGFVEKIDAFCRDIIATHPGISLRLGSIMGRYWAMDRDKRWERVERAWRTLVVPIEPDVESVFAEASPANVVQNSYDAGITDEFVEPVAIGTDGVSDGDSIIFFNFRPDRARELTRAFIDPDFESYGFTRPIVPKVNFVCMTEYDPAFAALGAAVAFDKSFPANVLADHLACLGLRQLHIAETEKYAHVTFFFNGGIEEPKPGEQRILVPSPKVATYDLQPEMSAPAVTDELVKAIEANAADVYIVNYANGDMVGHTGIMPAAVAAIEAVDTGLRRVIEAIRAKGGVALVTADHGNSEQMVDPSSEDGSSWTAHTTNEVPLVLIADKNVDLNREQPARLADIAPTLLDLMQAPIPQEFTGQSLLVRRP
jgi:2,3-bisphosphoglycerate-independent phosphoglycerate mutase